MTWEMLLQICPIKMMSGAAAAPDHVGASRAGGFAVINCSPKWLSTGLFCLCEKMPSRSKAAKGVLYASHVRFNHQTPFSPHTSEVTYDVLASWVDVLLHGCCVPAHGSVGGFGVNTEPPHSRFFL